MTFAFQTFGYLLNWLKDGSLYKLKKLDKDYKLYLGQEEKKLLKKRINEGVSSRLVGINDIKIKRMLIYVLNRSDLRMTKFKAAQIGKYLVFDGKRFYFDFKVKSFWWRRSLLRIAGFIYMFYMIMTWVFYAKNIGINLSLWVVIILTIIFGILSLFCLFSLPTNKDMRTMNGQLLKVDIVGYAKFKSEQRDFF